MVFLYIILLITLSSEIRVHRAGSQLKNFKKKIAFVWERLVLESCPSQESGVLMSTPDCEKDSLPGLTVPIKKPL